MNAPIPSAEPTNDDTAETPIPADVAEAVATYFPEGIAGQPATGIARLLAGYSPDLRPADRIPHRRTNVQA